jgi:dihydrofolate reductase
MSPLLPRPTLSLILACDLAWGIGKDGKIPWKCPADMARFKALTMGKPLIMGRRTYESIGRPLPGRRMVVLSRQLGYTAPGCEVAGSLAEALELLRGAGEVFVGGGAAVYQEALPLASRVYLTLIYGQHGCDTSWPGVTEVLQSSGPWREGAVEMGETKDGLQYDFRRYERAGG